MSASPAEPVAAPLIGLSVKTVAAPGLPADLIAALPRPTGSLSFVSEGEGLVGWGELARFTATGSDAAARIDVWWNTLCETFDVQDEVGGTSTGPVVFVSLGFSDDDESVAIVPRTVLGCRDGRSFITTIGPAAALTEPEPVTAPGPISYADASASIGDYAGAVEQAVRRIRAGEADKVVLARDLLATAAEPVDQRHLLRRLADSYPTCWTFAVDGLLGATPEMLLRRQGSEVSSRVLAGTAWPERAGEHTTGRVATGLLASVKDLSEHAYAVTSVATVLSRISSDLRVPGHPHILPLANLTHLATDISGTIDPPAPGARTPSALLLAAGLHPTAAVGGSPTEVATRLIAELEPMKRGRYAAPVGWMSADGDGEFGIALRCAEVDGRQVRMFAGCGIMAGSDPQVEAREAQIKMIPIRDALEG